MDVYELRIGKLVANFMIGCMYLLGNLIGFRGITRVRFIDTFHKWRQTSNK